jgi:hypothetical protein
MVNIVPQINPACTDIKIYSLIQCVKGVFNLDIQSCKKPNLHLAVYKLFSISAVTIDYVVYAVSEHTVNWLYLRCMCITNSLTTLFYQCFCSARFGVFCTPSSGAFSHTVPYASLALVIHIHRKNDTR